MFLVSTPFVQWWQMLVYLGVALVLSSAVGLERQFRSKAAGLRTHTLVGLGAALFVVVSKYGFTDVITAASMEHIRLDPSRVAAQIVSGVGFIGAGLVFVKRSMVRGLTTAASIWLVAAIGTSAGAGLIIPAIAVTIAHLLVTSFYTRLLATTRLGDRRIHQLRIRYHDGTGALRKILLACTQNGFQIQGFEIQREGEESLQRRGDDERGGEPEPVTGTEVEVSLELEGIMPASNLVHHISDLRHVTGVYIEDEPE